MGGVRHPQHTQTGSNSGVLREIHEGRRSIEVGSFPDSFPKFSLLPTIIPLLHTYVLEFAGMCDSHDEQRATHLPHPPL